MGDIIASSSSWFKNKFYAWKAEKIKASFAKQSVFSILEA